MRLSQPNYTSNVLKLNDHGSPAPWVQAKEQNQRKKVVTHKFNPKCKRLALT